ncbi:hypothetical protein [Aliiroseovarius sp.]|uniref:hypothetical protein n=1 Tax=Aliiroseovarius sp. TaxID=1872442 RepID=UPI003BAADF4F
MFENLRKLYRHYGGSTAVLTSWYFWVAFILSSLSYSSIVDASWSEVALGVLPSLTGFTIAAFAIIFAILDADLLKKLMGADENGYSPISTIAASIGHAVFVQVAALLIASAFQIARLESLIDALDRLATCHGYSIEIFVLIVEWGKYTFSGIGLLFTYYGIVLVLAAILSIVRMQLIVASTMKTGSADKKSKN